MAQTTWKRSACPYDCPDGCGLLVETDGKCVYRVKGDPEHPVTRGFVCRKMQHYERTVHSPRRIPTPLRRVGEKGKGEFVPISWEEAVDEITTRWKALIAAYGAESILPYSYAGTEHQIQYGCGEAFFGRLGASRLEVLFGVILPLLKTTFATGFISIFTSCMTSVGAIIFLISPGKNVASAELFQSIENGRYGVASVQAVLIILVTVGINMAFMSLTKRRERGGK